MKRDLFSKLLQWLIVKLAKVHEDYSDFDETNWEITINKKKDDSSSDES